MRFIRSRRSRHGSRGRAAASPRVDAIPFEIRAQVHGDSQPCGERREMPARQGRAGRILDHCDRQQTAVGRGARPCSFEKAGDRLAAQGERVLGLAWLPSPGVPAGSLTGGGPAEDPRAARTRRALDPPRKEAIEAVRECQAAGSG